MDSSVFRVIEHTIPCSYIRDYPNATQGQKDNVQLQLSIKQYLPVDPVGPDDRTAVTLISAHAIALPKEAYEPLWEELYNYVKPLGVRIRSIWIADMANHGASGVLNEQLIGDDPGWHELSRDLLHMVNVFRKDMPRPIIGIAHSAGAAQIAHLSLLHPRLFAGLALIEPMIQQDVPPGPVFAGSSTRRRDLWPTRGDAEIALRKSPFSARFDPRVLQRMSQYGLRSVPTAVYPTVGTGGIPEGAVTLTTTKHQEVWTYLRPNFTERSETVSARDRLLAPDADHSSTGQYLFFRPEFGIAFLQLPHLRPRILFVFGGRSPMSTPKMQAAKISVTGTGTGGGGGVDGGQITTVSFPEDGHMLPCEKIKECAGKVGDWLADTLRRWGADEQVLKAHDPQKSERGMLVVSPKWVEMTKNKGTAKRLLSGTVKL